VLVVGGFVGLTVFLYRMNAPSFLYSLLSHFQLDDDDVTLRDRWRKLVLVVAALTAIITVLVFIAFLPPDPEDPCTWRTCP